MCFIRSTTGVCFRKVDCQLKHILNRCNNFDSIWQKILVLRMIHMSSHLQMHLQWKVSALQIRYFLHCTIPWQPHVSKGSLCEWPLSVLCLSIRTGMRVCCFSILDKHWKLPMKEAARLNRSKATEKEKKNKKWNMTTTTTTIPTTTTATTTTATTTTTTTMKARNGDRVKKRRN